MNDKELADKVVALGVGVISNRFASGRSGICYDLDGFAWPMRDDVFVRDWRVAGALMEKCPKKNSIEIEIMRAFSNGKYWSARFAGGEPFGNISLPRAIIEACVEALTSEEE